MKLFVFFQEIHCVLSVTRSYNLPRRSHKIACVALWYILPHLKKLTVVLFCDKDPSLTGKLISIGCNNHVSLPFQFSFCSNCSSLKAVPLFIQARTRVKLNFLDSIAKFWELQVNIFWISRLFPLGRYFYCWSLTSMAAMFTTHFLFLKKFPSL